ncbi:MAG TPA: molybdopterin oxidoreductase, partial [Casimicrobiaceae bacterium]
MSDDRPDSIVTNACRGEAAHEHFWRSIAEAQSHGAAEIAPAAHSLDMKQSVLALQDRRNFMKILGASLALAGAGCARTPLEKIVPYRDGPPQQTYGKPVYYASALGRDGYGLGVLVATQMGRPTKIEGNPHHPASLGATDVFAQSAVLELWDPDRSKTVRHGDTIGTWNGFVAALHAAMQPLMLKRGKGLRILSDTVTSPSLHAQIAALLKRLPEAHWHQWQPLNRDNAYAGTRLAFG